MEVIVAITDFARRAMRRSDIGREVQAVLPSPMGVGVRPSRR